MAVQRYIVVDDTSGDILRSGWSSTPALQAGAGQAAITIEGTDGGVISDVNVKVNLGSMSFEAVGSYSGDLPLSDALIIETVE